MLRQYFKEHTFSDKTQKKTTKKSIKKDYENFFYIYSDTDIE